MQLQTLSPLCTALVPRAALTLLVPNQLVYCSLSPGLSLAELKKENVLRWSQRFHGGSCLWVCRVCDKQLPGLRPKPFEPGGETALETGVYWGKFRVMGNCCVQALEDTTIAGSTLNSLLARALRLSGCCKPEKLPCCEIPASAAAGKHLGRASSSSAGLENLLFGSSSVYGIIILFTVSSWNSSPFLMSFERTGK